MKNILKFLEKYTLKYSFFLVFIIFFVSIVIFYFFLYLERKILNISSIYHPDAVFYLENYRKLSYLSIHVTLYENLLNFFQNIFSNRLYPSFLNIISEVTNILNSTEITFFHDSEYRNFLKFNFLFFLIGNILIFINYANIRKKINFLKDLDFYFLLILVFLPYKMHLTISLLKDSLIIFFLIIFVIYRNYFVLFISVIFGISLRFGFLIYFLIFLKEINSKKSFVLILTLLLLLFLFILYKNNLINNLDYFISRGNVVISGREYDQIPDFRNHPYGLILKIIFWPLIFLSGSFSFFSDSYLFYILSAEIIFVQILFYILKKKLVFNYGLIILLGIISFNSLTFTSFFRYSYTAFYIYILYLFFDLLRFKKI